MEIMSPANIPALKREILSSMHCALPGIVESFDPVSGTAMVRPALRRVCHPDRSGGISRVIPGAAEGSSRVIPSAAEGSSRVIPSAVEGSLEYPLLRDVPVFMPVPFEVSPGDACLVVFADREIDAWLEGGEEKPSGRMHSLSDGFAFVGWRTRANG